MGFFALGEADLEFDVALFPVEGEGDQRKTLPVDAAGEAVEFEAVHQQAPVALGVRYLMGGSGRQGRDLGAKKPGLAVFEQDIALVELNPAHTQAFDFPALKGNAGLKTLL